MPNIGGPKQRKRALLSSVITSVVTYDIFIWVPYSVYRLNALRVASAYRTVSEDVMYVIPRMLSIEMLVEERRCRRFGEMRRVWESDLGREVLPETMVEAMLSSQAAWDATSNAAAAVIKKLRREERKRKAIA
ncbi:uncharacterized protein LOC107046092 [Diachasma alloeum]|uniref:uncharacterized protein LOC107046092 n=1 Tax=Diachasma alloeum TaxID=454923 RepID=UPI0007383089|nr:uncharacterized protein LOC107046092 [Diachasma alloeum]